MAAAAVSTGAMNTSPAAPCSISRSTLRRNEAGAAPPGPTVMDRSAVTAARPSASTIEDGPNRVVFCATTPTTLDRPVASTRADWLRR